MNHFQGDDKVTEVNLKVLAEKWPSTIVARSEVRKFSGGIVNPRTLANLDCLGLGPEGRFYIGRKCAYPVDKFICWLEKQTSLPHEKPF